jgi:serine protease Do
MDVGSSVVSRFKGNRVLSTLLILMTLTVGILIGTVISRGVKGSTNLAGDATPVQMATPQQLSSAFSTIAKQIEPSVVNINTESTVRPQRRGRRAPAPEGEGDDNFQDFFDRFFGGPGGDQSPFGSPEGTRQRSLGSGVILDAKGYIVTNAHVVDKADRIRVNLMDDAPGVQYDAKVIGVDRETDLAVIKIEPKKAARSKAW